METRKEIRELHRMACPILCHYVLTSLFEMFDQAIIGQNSTRGFALVGIASVVLYGATGALGMLSSAFHILAAEKKGEQDESGFWTVFLVSRELGYLDRLWIFHSQFDVWQGAFSEYI